MGFSTSGATVIIFLGVLVCASVLVPAAEQAYEEVSDARDGRADRLLDRRNSDAEISNATYDGGTLDVTVNNTGTVTLDANATDLLVNGTLRTEYETTVGGEPGRSLWLPGESLTFSVSGVASPPDRVKVVVETGVADASTNVTVVS